MKATMFRSKHVVLRNLLICMVVLAPFAALAACDTDEHLDTPGCTKETVCGNGAGPMKACFTRDKAGACTALTYSVGSVTYPCVSCSDEAYCSNAAAVACGIPGSSIPADAVIPDGGPIPDASHD